MQKRGVGRLTDWGLAHHRRGRKRLRLEWPAWSPNDVEYTPPERLAIGRSRSSRGGRDLSRQRQETTSAQATVPPPTPAPAPALPPSAPAVEETVGLEKLVAQQKAQAKEALKKQLQSMSPTGFEHFVGRLLETMGFVDVVVTQRSYDGGIDGHCKHPVLDMNVVFQAKRWSGPVGGDPVAAFRGRVMARFGRGFFITTSSFTPGAREMFEEAGGAKIIPIDGDKLTDLMIEKGLGVEERPLTYWQVNEDFFSQFR